jgi:sugar phosphate isomerase/epimerase
MALTADSQTDSGAARPEAASIFAKQNLVAWCIVPFDAKKRGPEARAQMLKRLGISRFAYDYRAEHIPTFDEEMQMLKKYGIELTAFWFPGAMPQTNKESQVIFDLLRRHNLKTQLWVSMGDPAPKTQDQAAKVEAAAKVIRAIADEAAKIGCTVALYNHGGWYGEPENQIAIVERVKRPNVGIVYNFHHGHDQMDRFPELFKKMQPYLLAVNINGMIADGPKKGKMILPLGQGDRELAMLKIIQTSGYRGPIGILNHRAEVDAEQGLRENIEGLRGLLKQLGDEKALQTY